MQLVIFLQRSEYNGVRDEDCNFFNSLPSKYFIYFSGSDDKVVCILFSIKMSAGKDMYIGQYICDVFYYNTGT